MHKEFKVTALFGSRKSANFTKEGMVGVERKNPDRPVSIMTLSARQEVDQAALRGLCYQKFTADITLDCDALPDTGEVISAGELQLGILPERKRCWPECILLEKDLPCALIEGVRYAWVKTPGSLRLGDSFKILE
jgi:hypothetical protein